MISNMRRKTDTTTRSNSRKTFLSLANQVYEKIRNEILTCVLEPGQQVTQAQLVDKFRVGITPVRDALQRLAQEGLVQPIPRSGYLVSPITFADIGALYEFRGILEAAAIRLAVERASDEQLDTIARAADFTYTFRDRQSYTDFLSHNADFHRSIALAAGNPRLAGAITLALGELTRVFHLGLDLRDRAQEMHTEHIALIQALRSRDLSRAEQIHRSQIAARSNRHRRALCATGDRDPAHARGRHRSSIRSADASRRVSVPP